MGPGSPVLTPGMRVCFRVWWSRKISPEDSRDELTVPYGLGLLISVVGSRGTVLWSVNPEQRFNRLGAYAMDDLEEFTGPYVSTYTVA